ncbi:MAG: hypothetical protein NTV17_02775, partial [Burkholderiales bacterium]|nr:hypothetical protein [Burkholderiales bacterium]
NRVTSARIIGVDAHPASQAAHPIKTARAAYRPSFSFNRSIASQFLQHVPVASGARHRGGLFSLELCAVLWQPSHRARFKA